MNDVLKDFGSSGAVQAPNPLSHPMADAIRAECISLLEKTNEGKRLLEFANQYSIKINVITGREPNYVTYTRDETTLICPAVTKAVDLDEMACNLAMGLRECESGYNGVPLTSINLPQADKDWSNYRKTLDSLTVMCKIAYEFSLVNNNTKLIDLVKKLGHYKLYEGVLSGLNDEELGKILITTVNETRTKG
ncbi:MAG: hypothetical protein A3J37_05430 [Alphaproteobacteria bacterium RIFCSPHIGHO2_12_FULL_45_9]|nr:MAG: hypothetical protein A3B66_07950 [Alphaproteobacteria bacterium RIFCSPHIGHO2_02_FULL_46_13]OFW98612.1 MAG: hypothetical protein A3J37_05430 [Alphaproteobacteria bacterium RIFCSPHIGHO2_12_FULL_45_9]